MADFNINRMPRTYKPLPTQERLQQLLIYLPDEGSFIWRQRAGDKRFNTRYAGKDAGCFEAGYIVIVIDRAKYAAARVAWKYVNGTDPVEQVDHCDTNKANNKIANLREATTSQNKSNIGPRADNTSGFKGAYWRKDVGRWSSSITAGGRRFYLGYFKSAADAHAAYCEAAKRLHGEFARVK